MTKGHERIFLGVGDRYVYVQQLDGGEGFMYTYPNLSCTLNMCMLLYVSCASMKLLKNEDRRHEQTLHVSQQPW